MNTQTRAKGRSYIRSLITRNFANGTCDHFTQGPFVHSLRNRQAKTRRSPFLSATITSVVEPPKNPTKSVQFNKVFNSSLITAREGVWGRVPKKNGREEKYKKKTSKGLRNRKQYEGKYK